MKLSLLNKLITEDYNQDDYLFDPRYLFDEILEEKLKSLNTSMFKWNEWNINKLRLYHDIEPEFWEDLYAKCNDFEPIGYGKMSGFIGGYIIIFSKDDDSRIFPITGYEE